MSHDDKDEKDRVPPFDDARVDRDDPAPEGDEDAIESDGPVAESSSPDPGYSAFADDFDDPLADWPGPATDAGAADDDDFLPEDEEDDEDDEDPDDDEPLKPEPGELAFDEADDDTSGTAVEASADDDDIVDDFLSDLDDDEALAAAPVSPTSSSVVAATAAAGAAPRPTGVDRDEPEHAAIANPGAARLPPHAAVTGDEGGRRVPMLMVGIAVLALVLLGVGGYGVMQERQALEAEIRDLQGRLAVAMSPEESTVVREQLRQLEVDKETLLAQVRDLREETASLREAVEQRATLAATATDGNEDSDTGDQDSNTGAREAVATDEQPAEAADSDTVEPATAPAGGERWFVNFGSYSRELVAQQWAEQLEVERGQVVVQSATSGERTVYRVRVIDLSSRDEAERVALGLERSFQLPRLWIGRQ